MAGKRRQRFERQARRQGRLRYAPEESALGLLEQDARRDFRDTRASSRSAADSIVGSAREGRQDIRGIYEDAGLTDLVRTGLDSNPAARRIAEEMAEAETEMVNRGIDAREGAQFQIREARQQRDRALTDIGRRRTTLANEKGLFVNDLLSQLIGEDNAARAAAQQRAADLLQRERTSMWGAGVNPNTGMAIPGGRLDPDADGKPGDQGKGKSKKWLTSSQMQAQGAEFARAQEIARTMLRNAGGNATQKLRVSIGKALLAGREAVDVPIYDPSTGGRKIDPKTGEQVAHRSPAVKPVDPHIATAALDMVMLGALTPATVKMLRALGVRVKQLPGVTMPARSGPRYTLPSRPGNAPGTAQAPWGPQRPT